MKTQLLNDRRSFDSTAVAWTRLASRFATIGLANLLAIGAMLSPFNGQTAFGQVADGNEEARPTRRATLPPQVEKIDKALEASWSEAGIRPSPVEEDLKWVRRVYLDIIGRIPSFEEFASFAKDKSPDRRVNLVRKLLDDDQYTEEYANHWGTIWTNILIGRNGGMEERSLTNRAGMQKYLRDCFASNKPYNTMVYELVTATGTTKPGSEKFNGAANFLAMKVNEEKGVQATAAVSRIFLGLQVQCTQCHNHPFNQWKQQKFWEFNAFFRQTRALRQFVRGTNDIDQIELINEDFAGEGSHPRESRDLLRPSKWRQKSRLSNFHRWHRDRQERLPIRSQPPQRAWRFDDGKRLPRQSHRQSRLGTLSRIRIHETYR